MLDKIDFTNLGGGAETWEKAVRKVRVGMMPPQGMPQPDEATRARLVVSALTTRSMRAAVAHPNPGRPLLHRLNRAEYANAIRDLLALDVDPTTLLPPDDSAYGFDNIGDVLGCLASAARTLHGRGGQGQRAGRRRSRYRSGQRDVSHPAGRVTGRRTSRACRSARSAASSRKVTLPLDGEYMLTVQMFRTNLGVMRGLEYEHEIEYTVDGQRVHASGWAAKPTSRPTSST